MAVTSAEASISEPHLLLGDPQCAVFSATGPDCLRYLQGRITQDVKGLQPKTGVQSLVLTPQGKIQGQFYLLREESGFTIVSDPFPTETLAETRDALIEEFRHSLLQFKVADQLEIALTDKRVLSLQGPGAVAALLSLGVQTQVSGKITHSTHSWNDISFTVVEFSRGLASGFDLLIPQSGLEQFREHLLALPQSKKLDFQGLELLRITAGTPRMQADIDETVLATEIPYTELISFKKGCYSGQEPVEMSTARGRPNRRFVRFSSTGTEPFSPKTEIVSALKKVCGTITSSIVSQQPERIVSLGFVKTSVSDTEELFAAGIQLNPY